MSRKIAVLSLLLFSLSAYARSRALSQRETHPQGGTVSGIVESVQGNLIRLADGLVVVDASDAKIVIGRGREATVGQIEPGMLLFATIDTSGKASMITATRFGDATLFGAVDSVDVAAQTLTLLGYTASVDDETSFGSYRKDQDLDLSDIVRNQLVQVQVDAVNGRLIAREVLVLAPVPPQISGLRGTVKSIGTDSWEIESGQETVSVVVNAQTKIVGSPKVGDTVEVLYSVDSANNKVAISIVKIVRLPPVKVVQFHGKVKSVTGATWVVTVDGEDKTFTVNDHTKITTDTGVGDFVQVLASQADDGALTALVVMKLRF
ncbi:MAG TPA: DUF5666 domain-containing protein [Thermoanaerobaculia bacterium]|jgi:hypothetical protein|nr:DUF5666 domain-containing protein [Thermoanaerobaculia bacterium]